VSDDAAVVEAVDAADEDAADQLGQVDRLATVLDDSIRLPGGYRIGVDPLVGLLPVVGDLSASAVSVYIVLEAAYLGVPRATLARMVFNVGVDTVVGSVPVVGPLFDAVWKCNARNVALLSDRVEDPAGGQADRLVLAAMGVLLVALSVAGSATVGLGAWWLAGQAGLV
jgi:hypothetical protein